MDGMQKHTPKWTNCNVFHPFAIVCFWKCKFSLLTTPGRLSALTPASPSPRCDLPCRSPGPNSACNEVPRGHWEQSLARQGSVCGQARGLGLSLGGCPGRWALHCACWQPGQPLGFGVSRARHWKLPSLASLQKWTGENGWFAKENNPQVDQGLEKPADCSREIIKSMWMVTGSKF